MDDANDDDDDDGHDADSGGHLQTTGEADSLGSNGRTPQLQLDVDEYEALAAQRRRRQLRRLDCAQYRPKASSIAAVARSGIGSGKGGPTVSGLVSSVHVLTRARVEAERRRQARELTSYRQRARVWK